MDAGFTTTFSRFNSNMNRYCDELGMAGKAVLLRQGGLLNRTLINITPPTTKRQTERKIDASIDRRVASIAAPARDFTEPMGGKAGQGDVHWYNWTHTALYGVKRDSDMLQASPEELYEVLKRVNENRGTIDAGQRGKQHVWIRQKIVTLKATVDAVKRKLKKRIGRLKAAWAVSWQDCGSPVGTLGPVPQWVLEHVSGSRSLATGFMINNLGIPGHPALTFVNNAAGVSNLAKLGIFKRSLEIRCKAMATDLALYASGKKK